MHVHWAFVPISWIYCTVYKVLNIFFHFNLLILTTVYFTVLGTRLGAVHNYSQNPHNIEVGCISDIFTNENIEARKVTY